MLPPFFIAGSGAIYQCSLMKIVPAEPMLYFAGQ
jgi:hypothetical protein